MELTELKFEIRPNANMTKKTVFRNQPNMNENCVCVFKIIKLCYIVSGLRSSNLYHYSRRGFVGLFNISKWWSFCWMIRIFSVVLTSTQQALVKDHSQR